MKAVLPGVRTAGVLVFPVVTLAEVGCSSVCSPLPMHNTQLKWLSQRVKGRLIVVIRCDKRIITNLTTFYARPLSKTPNPAADHGMRGDPIGKADSRLPFVPVITSGLPVMAVDAIEELHATNLELVRRQHLRESGRRGAW